MDSINFIGASIQTIYSILEINNAVITPIFFNSHKDQSKIKCFNR